MKNTNPHLERIYLSQEVKHTGCNQTIMLARKWLNNMLTLAYWLSNMLLNLDIQILGKHIHDNDLSKPSVYTPQLSVIPTLEIPPRARHQGKMAAMSIRSITPDSLIYSFPRSLMSHLSVESVHPTKALQVLTTIFSDIAL